MDRGDAEHNAEKLLYATTSGDRIRSLYCDVLSRLPEDFVPPDVIVLADANTAFQLALRHRYVPDKKFPEMCDVLMGEARPWIALLDGALWHRRKDCVTGVIAHELAHYYLKHQSGKVYCGRKLEVDNEKAADGQAKNGDLSKRPGL